VAFARGVEGRVERDPIGLGRAFGCARPPAGAAAPSPGAAAGRPAP